MKTILGTINISINIEFDSITEQINTSIASAKSVQPMCPADTEPASLPAKSKDSRGRPVIYSRDTPLAIRPIRRESSVREKYNMTGIQKTGYKMAHWTEEDKDKLLELVSVESDMDIVARKLERTTAAAYSAVKRFKIYDKIKDMSKPLGTSDES